MQDHDNDADGHLNPRHIMQYHTTITSTVPLAVVLISLLGSITSSPLATAPALVLVGLVAEGLSAHGPAGS